jgi:hypothetical protein
MTQYSEDNPHPEDADYSYEDGRWVNTSTRRPTDDDGLCICPTCVSPAAAMAADLLAQAKRGE